MKTRFFIYIHVILNLHVSLLLEIIRKSYVERSSVVDVGLCNTWGILLCDRNRFAPLVDIISQHQDIEGSVSVVDSDLITSIPISWCSSSFFISNKSASGVCQANFIKLHVL